MNKIILYIATSLDGFIADEQGGIDWLNEFSFTKEIEQDYNEFYNKISTVVMGGKTYRQVINELSPGKWVYEGKESFVFTRNKLKDTENVKFISGDIAQKLREIQKNSKGNIWVIGGFEIVNSLIKENIIDEYIITLIPTLIGKGIPLFKENTLKLNLVDCKNMGSDIVKLTYKK